MTATDLVVLDANVAIVLARRELIGELAPRLAAPALMVIETRAVLHREGRREGVLPYTRQLQERIEGADVRILDDPAQRTLAWSLATDMQWNNTYDAEYLAAAIVNDLPLATFDKQLARAARQLGVALTQLP